MEWAEGANGVERDGGRGDGRAVKFDEAGPEKGDSFDPESGLKADVIPEPSEGGTELDSQLQTSDSEIPSLPRSSCSPASSLHSQLSQAVGEG